MRFLYTISLYCLTPFILLRLWWKGRRLPAYRQRIAERFALGSKPAKPVDIWVHAVSLGEVIAAMPLIDALLAKQWRVLVTTMTPTGSERVRSHFGSRVAHQYVPYDLPGVLRRFLRQFQPQLGLIMETELWPNLISEAHRFGMPLMLANARLSPSSFKAYKRCKWFFKPLLNQFAGIFAQSADDAKRFRELGAAESLVKVLGNMKFDVQTQQIDSAGFEALKELWGKDRVVVIAASTHDNEEEQILNLLKRMQKAIPQVLLLIAPRHPERFQNVYQLATNKGFTTVLRSQSQELSENTQVVIIDSLGELLGFYQLSTMAFVGGSLVSVGGHNVLEPIAMRTPVISGTQVHNFKTICRDLEEAQAIILVEHAENLLAALIRLYEDKELYQSMVTKALAVLEQNKGSVSKYVQEVSKIAPLSSCGKKRVFY